jgi:hypothetical protein
MGRVRIGTCAGPADAALVRAMFDAHGIPVVVGAEHHASMLGGLGGAAFSLDILVDEADAEEASALLRDLREHEASAPEPDEPDEDEEEELDPDPVPIEVRVDRRRRTGIALLLACCITFGTGHMFARAWLRGLLLAGLEIFSIRLLIESPLQGALLFAATILTDAIGAIVRVRRLPRPIPPARIARR